MIDWKDKKILEIGCGKGRLASLIKIAGAKNVIAVDYSKEAINVARKNYNLEGLNYICENYRNIKGKFDIVVLQGVLEHFDKPFEELKYIQDNFIDDAGFIITSSPSFLNLRGHIWMTLQLLFNIPMSLTDLHFLCPFDFEDYCQNNKLTLTYKSSDQDWGCGKRMIIDFEKRLRNALKDANMNNEDNVMRFLNWLKKVIEYPNYSKFTGANVVYKINIKI